MGIIILSNNVNTLGKGCDNMNTIYDKYMLKFNSMGTAFSNVYDYRKFYKSFIIIEAEKYSNPTNYSRFVFEKLGLKGDEVIILDLSNISGMSMNSFFIWKFILDDNKLSDEKFIQINLLRNDEYEKYFKDYLFSKMKKIRSTQYKMA